MSFVTALPAMLASAAGVAATEAEYSERRNADTFLRAGTPLREAVMASVARDEDDYCGLAPRRRWGRLANRSTWTSLLCSARQPTEVACMGRVR